MNLWVIEKRGRFGFEPYWYELKQGSGQRALAAFETKGLAEASILNHPEKHLFRVMKYARQES